MLAIDTRLGNAREHMQAQKIANVDRLHFDISNNVVCAIVLLNREPDAEHLADNLRHLSQYDPCLSCFPDLPAARRWLPLQNFEPADWIKSLAKERVENPFEAAAGHMPEDFEPGTPMWRILLIPRIAPQNSARAAVVLYAHHALVDGYRGIAAVRGLSDDHARRVLPAGRGNAGQAPGRPRAYGSPLSFIRLARHELAAIHWRLNPPTHKPPGRLSFNTINVDLDALRAAAPQRGATFPEAFLSVSSAAQSDLIRRCREKRHPTIVAIVPALVSRNIEPSLIRTGFLPLIVAIPAGTENPQRYALGVRAALERAHGRVTFEGHRSRSALFSALPRRLRTALYAQWARRTDMLCTIIPGPSKPISLGGAEVTALYGFPPVIEGNSAAFCVVTYAGRLFGSIAAKSTRQSLAAEIACDFTDRHSWFLS